MIELQLFGGLTIEADGLTPESRSRRRHPLALLALAAVAAPQPVSREKLMAMLWPESDAERASNSLRQTMYWLRRELGEDVFVSDSSGGVQLQRAGLRVDVWSFRDAMDRLAYDEAVENYKGAFLDGVQIPGSAEFSHWVDSERERLQRQFLSALDALAQKAADEERYSDAIKWRRRQAAADPYSSRVALALLNALVAGGDRPGALEYAAIYENLLRTQLEVEPDPTVVAFVDALREQPAAVRRFGIAKRAVAVDALPDPPRRWSRLVPFAAIAVFGLFGAWVGSVSRKAGSADAANTGTTIVLASGASQLKGRDPSIRLVACDGVACPPGSLPQNAFVTPKHPYYALPVSGTSYISPVEDPLNLPSKSGFRCCTTATFEQVFTLPAAAVSATVLVSVLADNKASVAINGVRFGTQADSLDGANYAGPPALFATTFAPNPSGINRLHVTLWDGGGALGLYYHAVVTYETNKTDSLTIR